MGCNRLSHYLSLPYTAILYNCAELGNNCSVCLAANTDTAFDCAWCGAVSTCDVETQCSGSPTTMFPSCPAPIITSISPDSGPPTGGTVITIRGTDLGVTYDDVDGNVYLGEGNGTQCVTSMELYQPGVQIGCVTPDFSDQETPFTLTVRVELQSGSASGPDFTVKTPSIMTVDPAFGPVAGGVVVKVLGSSLDIGNVEITRVTFNGSDCTIQSMT